MANFKTKALAKIANAAEKIAEGVGSKAEKAAESIREEGGYVANQLKAEAAMVVAFFQVLTSPMGEEGMENLAEGRRAFETGNNRPKEYAKKLGTVASEVLGEAYGYKEGDKATGVVRKVLDLAAGFVESEQSHEAIAESISESKTEEEAVKKVAHFLGTFKANDQKGNPIGILDSRTKRTAWGRNKIAKEADEKFEAACNAAIKGGLSDAKARAILGSAYAGAAKKAATEAVKKAAKKAA